MATMNVADWKRRLSPYASPDPVRSAGQLAATLAIFVLAVAAAFAAHRLHWALGLPLSVLAGVATVKLFIIQHDCGHRSFFRRSATCDVVGRVLSVLTWTPYERWRRHHDLHHASSGDLDRRGIGDVTTLTVEEYRARGRMGRLSYRFYRHPAVLFGVAPSFLFLVQQRLPFWLGENRRGRMAASVMLNNAAIAAIFVGASLLLGWGAVATVWLPAVVTGATLGVWLFYIQHQFEDAYWKPRQAWTFVDAALMGCSYYRLPRWLHWATGNIGYHHVHHLAARIPNYRLANAYSEVAELRSVPSFGIVESLRCARLSLWCERRNRLVTFGEAMAGI
jgi:omega-6 fatty acid desaturase (delta-12 desaturase)